MDVSQNINLEKLISLFKKMKNGDLIAFESFYNLTYKIVYYKLLTYIKNEEVIKDLSQDIYLVFFKNLKEIKNDEACIKFLFVITKNKALDYLKTYKEMYEYNDNLLLSIYKEDRPIEDINLIIYIIKYKIKIKEKDIDIILFHDLKEYTFEEISSLFNIKLNTVITRYNRALNKIRNYFNKKGGY